MHGGVKVYRGNAAAARSYVEADHARVDDYYLAEGTALAERFVATHEGVEAVGALGEQVELEFFEGSPTPEIRAHFRCWRSRDLTASSRRASAWRRCRHRHDEGARVAAMAGRRR